MYHVRSHDSLCNDTFGLVGQVFDDLPLDKEIRIPVSLHIQLLGLKKANWQI